VINKDGMQLKACILNEIINYPIKYVEWWVRDHSSRVCDLNYKKNRKKKKKKKINFL
jgi:hypothetical protein